MLIAVSPKLKACLLFRSTLTSKLSESHNSFFGVDVYLPYLLI